jgi:hypothetical protein
MHAPELADGFKKGPEIARHSMRRVRTSCVLRSTKMAMLIKPLRLLIVDDSKGDAGLLLEALRSGGYERNMNWWTMSLRCAPRWKIRTGI